MTTATVKGAWRNFQHRRPTLAIILGSTGFAVAYGIAHDLVTAHVAVEHFTVHHVRIVDSESPVVMALLWGVIATWWFGAGAGLLFALAAQVGDGIPKLSSEQVLRAERRVLIGVWISAMVVLVGLYLFGNAVLPEDEKGQIAEWRSKLNLVAVASTHVYSYLANAIAAVGLTVWILVRRIRIRRPSLQTPQQPD